MNGGTHKAIGISTGILVATVGISAGYELAPMALVLAPLGSMMPDIDHHNTKLGRTRKKVMDIGTVAVVVGCACILIAGYLGYLGNSKLFKYTLTGVSIAIPCITILPRIKFIKKKIKFFTKHRGIMHTLLVPALCLGAIFSNINNKTFVWIVLGFTAGYVSHLLADSITHDMCPLLWPITEKCVGIPIVDTGSKMETISAVLIVGGELWLALMSLC